MRNQRREKRPGVTLRATGAKLFAMGFLTIMVVSIGLGGMALYRHVSETGYLSVQEIDVYGTRRVGGELADYLRLEPDAPLTEIDASLMEARIERHPWVDEAKVTKGFPDRLTIRIRERDPALFHLSEGRIWIVDRQGAWVKPFENDEGLDLPVVTEISPEPVTEAVSRLKRVADFADYWDSASSPARPGEIQYVSDLEVVVYPLGGGPRLHLPLDESKWREASRRVEKIKKESQRVGLQLRSIDLLFPDRAIAERET